MSNRLLAVATIVTTSVVLHAGYRAYQRNKERKEQAAAVRATVAKLIEKVPGYCPPSR